MDAKQPLSRLADGTQVRYVSSDSEALHYTSMDAAQEPGIIDAKDIIALDRRQSPPQLFHVASGSETPNDGPASVSLAKVHLLDLPEASCTEFPDSQTFLSERSRLDILVSTKSGTGLAESVWKQLIEPLLHAHGMRPDEQYTVHFTTSETTISELTRDLILPHANKGERQTVVLLSGDGGMVDIINTLIAGPRSATYQKPEIGLLPFGTGNALANSSGITGDGTCGLLALLKGQPREVPVFRAAFSPGARLLVNEGREERELDGFEHGTPVAHGAVVCSWGLHATLVADSDTTEYRKFGAERFKMAGKEALYPSDGSLPHAYTGKVSVLRPGSSDWTPIQRDEHGYVLATLVSHLESGFHISPSSQPLDGKLKLVHFGRLSGDDAMGVMTKAYQNGQHVDDEKVGYEEIDGLRIEFVESDAKWRRACIDGRIIRIEQRGWLEVKMCDRGVLDLLAP